LPRQSEPGERTCIVTREAKPVDALIRFVVAPDGEVVADLRRRLPGRGVWVTAAAATVEAAEKRRLFGRAFDAPAHVSPGLAGRVAAALAEAALGALSLARKAGGVVLGFAKVEAAIAREPVAALLHAAEAAPDGVGRLAQAARRRFGRDLPAIRIFTGAELDLAFGRPNVIHAALLTGPATDNLQARIRALTDFVGSDAGGGRPAHLTVQSAGL
jgi:predicted RNA-binding protein YlxR (DUF448 family)